MNPTQPQSTEDEELRDILTVLLDDRRFDTDYKGGLHENNRYVARILAPFIQANKQRWQIEARIEEQQKLILTIEENNSDKYPKIDETNALTYVSHGHALACKQFKRNATVRIAELNKLKEGKEYEN